MVMDNRVRDSENEGVTMFARISAGSNVRVALLQGATCNLVGPVTFVTRRKQATTASAQVAAK
jgi:hypothetical protein